ncbi:MAG TPA: hypothetical protein VG097_02700, partial [Gemmata sp.]|nr:hypothetical protein [Gemmata sp.]
MRGLLSSMAILLTIFFIMPQASTTEPLFRGQRGSKVQESKLKYPETIKGNVAENYHGTKVADPYHWLEDDVRKSKDVAEWVAAENKVTEAFLETITERAAIK